MPIFLRSSRSSRRWVRAGDPRDEDEAEVPATSTGGFLRRAPLLALLAALATGNGPRGNGGQGTGEIVSEVPSSTEQGPRPQQRSAFRPRHRAGSTSPRSSTSAWNRRSGAEN